eukprot:CAMPEP_0170299816 /NCGR_PEP_ID=MMETSP0116_2-20130129/50121_1 /TAXON_ID=400756 /ORGANISM="Durinskia baltica, Strain CSIRO CS-38" /LENGTH=31 /DNA_ID= /DNA_START= /DNA_END= /DNA_ORIENTATION=
MNSAAPVQTGGKDRAQPLRQQAASECQARRG